MKLVAFVRTTLAKAQPFNSLIVGDNEQKVCYAATTNVANEPRKHSATANPAKKLGRATSKPDLRVSKFGPKRRVLCPGKGSVPYVLVPGTHLPLMFAGAKFNKTLSALSV